MLFVPVMAAALLCGLVGAEPVDRIVAVVNEDVLTLSDLNNAFAQYRRSVEASYSGQELGQMLAEARQVILSRLIDDTLMEQEAKKTGILVREEEVIQAINNILAQRNTSMDELIKAIAKEGMEIDVYKKKIRNQIMKMKLVRRDLKAKLMVGDEEIGDYYRRHRADYEGKEAVRIKQILILFPRNASGETRARLRADTELLLKRLNNGEPFEKLAALYSQGPAASSGGDMGFIEKGSMLAEVEQTAFKLELNEVSGVIESPVGFHIIKVADKRGAGLKPLETVREEIRARIEEEKMEKKYDEWIEALRKKSHIEIKL